MDTIMGVVGGLWAAVTWLTFILLMGFLFAIMLAGVQSLISHNEPEDRMGEERGEQPVLEDVTDRMPDEVHSSQPVES